jgi:hypothetical protein
MVVRADLQSRMPTPDEEIRAFLPDEQIAEVKKLDMSLIYAESMLRELGLIVTEWQAAIYGLRQAEQDRARAFAATN